MSGTTFPVKLNLRIDWSEMDLFGHVNNVMFMKYIQASRVNYWERIGLMQSYEETKTGAMLASTACQFRRPLHYPGQIKIEAGIKEIGNTSFILQHRIFNEQNELAAEAEDVIVIYDFNSNSKVAFPEWLRKNIAQVEAGGA